MAGQFTEQVVRGRTTRASGYVLLRGELLVHHEASVPDGDAEPSGVDNGYRVAESNVRIQEFNWPPEQERDAALLRSGNVRRVTISPGDDGTLLSADWFERMAARLPADNAGVLMATPIYARNGDSRTAISPLLDRFSVRLKDDAPPDAWEALMMAHSLTAEPLLFGDLGPFRTLTRATLRQDPASAQDVLDALRADDRVRSADFVWLPLTPQSQAPPDAHRPARQWGMEAIDLRPGWRVAQTQQPTTVAIVDDWFDVGHPNLRFTPPETHAGLNEEPPAVRGHGTLIAGVIAAIPGNHAGITGITRESEILPIALGSLFRDDYVADAILLAVERDAKVLNLSLWLTEPDELVDESATEYAIKHAWNENLVICAAAGLYHPTDIPALQTLVDYPAYLPEIIAVGAVDEHLHRHIPEGVPENWGSKYGGDIDVVAPGVRIWTTDERGKLGLNPGGGAPQVITGSLFSLGDDAGDYFQFGTATSIATPHVSGLAALILECFPHLNNEQVREAIESTCSKVDGPGVSFNADAGKPNGPWDRQVGYGLINCRAALEYARKLRPKPNLKPDPDPDPRPDSLFHVPGVPVDGYPGDSTLPGHVRLYLSLDLRSWLDIPLVDVLQSQRLDEEYAGTGPPMTRVIVRAGAPVVQSHR